MDIEHIYFFSSYNVSGISSRYRGLYVLNLLKKEYNISFDFVFPDYHLKHLFRFVWVYWCILFFRKKNSLLCFQKLHSKGIYTSLLKILIKLKSKNSVYDTDDADYLRFDEKTINYFIKNCEACSVGSQALKKYAQVLNKNVVLLSSPVISHTEVKGHKNKVLHIGWVGHYGTGVGNSEEYEHKVSLNKIIFPALLELDFIFKLTILGVNDPLDKENIENVFRNKPNILLDIPEDIDWLDEISIYKRISKFDVGISPMINHEFNIAKSAFKAKQYLSCGVPVLGSPVGENSKFIIDGVNGYLCNSSLDFKLRITEFKEMNLDKYIRFKNNALYRVKDFIMESYCNEFVKYFSN